jgi:hypothetical protein
VVLKNEARAFVSAGSRPDAIARSNAGGWQRSRHLMLGPNPGPPPYVGPKSGAAPFGVPQIRGWAFCCAQIRGQGGGTYGFQADFVIIPAKSRVSQGLSSMLRVIIIFIHGL